MMWRPLLHLPRAFAGNGAAISAAWLAGMLLLTAAFIYLAAVNLADYHPVSEDDGWIMSASYKLAREGVFGSDLYAGFFNADRRYYISLPGLHMLQAATFKLLGSGIVQARLPVLAAGVAVLWLVSDLARRWYGVGAGLLTALLLVVWRANIIGASNRPPLLQVSQNGRYDVLALAFMWLTVWLLHLLLTRPGRLPAVLVGLTSAAAMLTQFFGLFILPVVLLAWLPARREARFRQLSGWMLVGFLALVLPYALYVLVDPAAFSGQAQLIQRRVEFGRLAFYLANLSKEPARYYLLLQNIRPPNAGNLIALRWGQAFLVVGVVPAIVIYLRTTRRTGGHILLPVGCLLSVALGLALLDSTKAPVYSIALWPALAMVFAVALCAAGRWLLRRDIARGFRVLVAITLFSLCALMLADGARSLHRYLDAAQQVDSYERVGARISRRLDPGATILGSEQWWWALRDHPYLALHNLWAQWYAAGLAGAPVTFAALVSGASADYLLVNESTRGNLLQYPGELEDQFRQFLEWCASRESKLESDTYGLIEIYRVTGADCQPPSSIESGDS